MPFNKFFAEEIVERALREDLIYGDLTTDNLVDSSAKSKAVFILKEKGVIAGLKIAEMVFKKLDENIKFRSLVKEGSETAAESKIAELEGPTAAILKGERTALNFLQRMSGIASETRRYVELVKDYPAKIVDTRKTTPTLRALEKYAVKKGGGRNHRMGLFDAVMIKDNHIKAAGGIEKAAALIKNQVSHTVKIEIEVEDLKGVKKALAAGADIIMLDNMDADELKEAVEYIDGRALIEASGGIRKENLVQAAAAGVDIISVGALTHQIKSLDIGLDLIEA